MDITQTEKQQILDFYNAGAEQGRLERGIGVIEWERSKEIISRYLPTSKTVIYDIGGGTGAYSRWLAALGHEVHMFELAPEAVLYAQKQQASNDIPAIHTIEVADARHIARADESADLVLLMGPLYHLPDRKERLAALHEATRLLKPGGTLLVAAISRFSSTLWGLSVFGGQNNLIDEAAFMTMIEMELTEGQHIRPAEYPKFISRAFFHLPADLRNEIEASGLTHLATIGVEGPVWIVPAFTEKWENKQSREALLKISSLVEDQESLLGMSPHMLAVARKKI
ncbi:class I SAM-dependent methyltransferase [Paenibacillus sp. 19GGS1-52]|uniref:class I SAM-dependent methyltransferase n=1 Tax=Paenibacillus sp. 19GGS1-52 TaxID=2758563 RepID=UPI001EFC1D23|nr:class I SAM-dependent methyltransferase [Paenibacillus sp. 19GGS1-52]ULO06374.1 class I SAM-dependent methyltransferase [Paenibacillus sp. 19GGS1-52]